MVQHLTCLSFPWTCRLSPLVMWLLFATMRKRRVYLTSVQMLLLLDGLMYRPQLNVAKMHISGMKG